MIRQSSFPQKAVMVLFLFCHFVTEIGDIHYPLQLFKEKRTGFLKICIFYQVS